jgi:hypothetical protein
MADNLIEDGKAFPLNECSYVMRVNGKLFHILIKMYRLMLFAALLSYRAIVVCRLGPKC